MYAMKGRFEEKYQKKHQESRVKFLNRPAETLDEKIMKADLLIDAIDKQDLTYVREIITVPHEDLSFINFRLYDAYVHDVKSSLFYQRNYYHEPRLTELPCTALTLASYLGLTQIVFELIQAGADVNITSQHSPLEYVIHYRKYLKSAPSIKEYRDIALLLINNGATYQDHLRELDTDKLLPKNKIYQQLLHDNSLPEKKIKKEALNVSQDRTYRLFRKVPGQTRQIEIRSLDEKKSYDSANFEKII
jgi:hypothetical protein